MRHFPLNSITSKKRPLYLFNLKIRSSTNNGDFADTLKIYSSMLRGTHPALQLGFQQDIFVQTSLLDMYSKFSELASARNAFDEMVMRNVVCWNTMISAYCRYFRVMEAMNLLKEMWVIGFDLIASTFVSVLAACTNLQLGLSMHCCVFKLRLLPCEIPLANSAVNMYVKFGLIDDARSVFDTMDERSILSLTTIIVFNLFNRMRQMGYVSQDMVLFVKIISSCVESGNLLLASSVHSLVLKSGFHGEALIDNSVLNMYSKCGDIVSARQVFEMVDEKCIFLWTSMIAANTQHGYPAEALDLFKSLLITDLKPNEATIASILSACADLGSLSIGNKIEHYAEEVFAGVLHKALAVWSSIINGYAIYGMGNEALKLFHRMQITRPCSLDHVVFTSILLACSHSGLMRLQVQSQVWAPLLSSCRKHHNIELGEYVAKKLLDLNPGNTSSYVLMANIYTLAGKWKEAVKTSSMMRNKGLVKEPGWSQIEINGSIHDFMAGDRPHQRSAGIYEKAGYVAETDMVVHDLENEEKEESMKVHSERLAVAWGLICTEPGTTLMIIKNLQTCGDCHSFLKFTSKVTRRHLIVRDGQRFRHFQLGSCSCKDFW
ncbi:hypothetical protein ERO13_A02G157102v2 [Gossypium hirsutum]|nr:hypothetical protein ERO13_A02G157102v2 [Gossypium hirsutum]